MNKHLKKFLEESYTKGFQLCAERGHKIGDLDVIFNAIVMASFAELIIKECAQIADEPTSLPFDSYGLKIKQHFGVEEL